MIFSQYDDKPFFFSDNVTSSSFLFVDNAPNEISRFDRSRYMIFKIA